MKQGEHRENVEGGDETAKFTQHIYLKTKENEEQEATKKDVVKMSFEKHSRGVHRGRFVTLVSIFHAHAQLVIHCAVQLVMDLHLSRSLRSTVQYSFGSFCALM